MRISDWSSDVCSSDLGVRSKRCGMEPPAFEAAAGEMFSGAGSQAPATGEVYDAGTGQSVVVLCGGTVPVRAVGYRAPADFEGEVSMVFYGTDQARSEEHTSELQSLMRTSYAVFCLKKKNNI